MTQSDRSSREPGSEILLYQTEDGQTRIDVRLENESAWLTQAAMAELFQTSPQNITLHIRHIYKDGELVEGATCKDYLQVQKEGTRGVRRRLKFYNLEMIIAVGYRVRSHRGTQFRQWATQRLNDYLVKGFAMDDERLKEAKTLGTDYFDELLERIRDIRASEKRFYLKIRDIYKLSVDYDPKADQTVEFFKVVQNKLHWAISGQTAAEIISERADASKPNMGLTSWKGAKVRRGDVTVAKNYLSHEEVEELNRVVVMYLDYAEDQTRKRMPIHMADWRQKLDGFLQFNERNILSHAGKITAEMAKVKALAQYEQFNQYRLVIEAQKDQEDFDQVAKRLESKIKESNE
jgi:hypothetical protein